MRVRSKRRKLASDGGTRRPDIDASMVTGEEVRAEPTMLSSNDVTNVADNPRSERISTNLRKPQSCGTWNVQGLSTGKLEIVTRRMEEQDIGVLGLSETWWLNQGRFTTDDGFSVVYSGKETGKREHGVGFILNKTTAKSFLGYNPVSDRVISLRLQSHPFNTTIVQVYAPTSSSS